MITYYKNFLRDEISNELIDYYLNNKSKVRSNKDKIYSFDALDIPTDANLKVFNKFNPKNPIAFRIQKLDKSVEVNEYQHTHLHAWSYLFYLNDNFIGGELLVEDNIIIKPKKNSLIVMTGELPHSVTQVIDGERLVLVCFSKELINIKQNDLI